MSIGYFTWLATAPLGELAQNYARAHEDLDGEKKEGLQTDSIARLTLIEAAAAFRFGNGAWEMALQENMP